MTDPDERGGGQELVALKELLGGSDVGLVKIVNDGSEKKQSDVSSGGGSSNGSSYEVAMQVDNSGPVLKNGRLPRTIKPVRYDLTVAPDLEASRLAGIVVIDTECLGGTNELWLHSDPAIVWEGVAVTREGTEIDGGDKDGETISGVTSFPVDQVVRVTLKRELAEGTSVQITVKFSATFSDKLVGFYKARYMEDNVIKSIGVTHLWPTEARRMLPCFDEPGLKAPFTVRMQRPVGLTALSNMPVKNTEPVAVSLLGQTENIVQDNFQETPNMSTYLLAMVLSDFANVNASDGTSKSQGPLVRVWMPPALAAQGRFAASISPPILKFYESLFDIPYPLPKMDLFVAPDLAYGAMENWGLITYRAQRLLFDPRVSTANDQVEIASTIAHEISHQWFGNLVTPNWWTDLWLNEGFASYMEVVPIQDLFPHWKAGEIIYSEKLRGVLVTDSLRASHPISKEGVTTTDEIMELFDDISYRKGSSLIRMIVSMMGQDAFFDALSKYLKKFIYGNASQDDLWHYLTLADVALREAGEGSRLPDGVGLKEIMDSWTLQTGYPVVTVSRANPEEQEDGGVRLKFFQSRFFLHPVGPNDLTFDEKAASKWWIPLNFAKGNLHDELGNVRYFGTDAPISWSDSRPHGWLDPSGDYGSVVEPREPPTVKTGDWVIVNVGHTGYYRVNYDETNWRLLAAALREDHTAISVVNRAQLVDDVLMLARAGYVEYDIAFDVLSYLEKEREYLPWSAALENFRFLMNMLTKDGDGGDDEILKKYLSTLIAPALSELKLDEPDGRQVAKPRLKKASESPVSEVPDVHEDLNSIWYRSLLLKWGCKLGDERILSDANDIFRKWMRAYDPDHPDEPTVLKPNDKETVYCYGIKQGGKAVWEFAVAHLVRTTVASERELLLSALACSDDAEVIRSFMDAIIQSVSGASYVDHADAITALLSVAASSYHGREHLMNLITNDWEEVRGLFGPGRKNVGRVFVQISRAVSSEKTLELIEEFAEKNSDALHGAGLLMQTARELLSANIRWQKEFREKFVEAVKNRTL